MRLLTYLPQQVVIRLSKDKYLDYEQAMRNYWLQWLLLMGSIGLQVPFHIAKSSRISTTNVAEPQVILVGLSCTEFSEVFRCHC